MEKQGGEGEKEGSERKTVKKNVNIPISKWDGEKASLRDRGKGCIVHTVRGK